MKAQASSSTPWTLAQLSALLIRLLLRPETGFILLGLLAGFLVYYATAWGPWAFSDATGYIVAARNLLAGHGIGTFEPSGGFSPLVSHPPLYVLSLAAIGYFGFDALTSARLLDTVLFAILASGSGFVFYEITQSRWLGMAFSGLLLIHPAILLLFLSAMSEPLFVTTGLGALLLAVIYLHLDRKWAFYASAGLAGLSLLTRYPGAAFIIAGAGATFLMSGENPWVRARRASAYTAIGVAPILAFLAQATTLPGAEGPRALRNELEIGASLVAFARKFAFALWTWKPVPPAVLLPDWLAAINISRATIILVGSLISAALLTLGAVTVRRVRQTPEFPKSAGPALIMIGVFGIFSLTYLGFFLTAFIFTNPTPDVDSRTMVPLLPAFLGIVLVACSVVVDSWSRSRWVRGLITTGILAAIGGYAIISQDIVIGLHRTGLGYTGRQWRQSETIDAIRELPSDVPIITNEPAAVTLLTGRTPYPIIEIDRREPVEAFMTYGSGPTDVERLFRDEGAALVLFDTLDEQFRSMYGDEAQSRLEAFVANLRLKFRGQDGAIYDYRSHE